MNASLPIGSINERIPRSIRLSTTVYLFIAVATLAAMFAVFGLCDKAEAKLFADTNPNDWYVVDGSLDFVTENEYITGYSNGLFGPYDMLTRGQAVTILNRMKNKGDYQSAWVNIPYTDVSKHDYFYHPVRWAVTNGIASGYGATSFGPNDYITREQLCVMLRNFASYRGADVTVHDLSSVDVFNDAWRINDWAREAVAWCVEQGIVSGVPVSGGLEFQPQANTQRCAMAKMFRITAQGPANLENIVSGTWVGTWTGQHSNYQCYGARGKEAILEIGNVNLENNASRGTFDAKLTCVFHGHSGKGSGDLSGTSGDVVRTFNVVGTIFFSNNEYKYNFDVQWSQDRQLLSGDFLFDAESKSFDADIRSWNNTNNTFSANGNDFFTFTRA